MNSPVLLLVIIIVLSHVCNKSIVEVSYSKIQGYNVYAQETLRLKCRQPQTNSSQYLLPTPSQLFLGLEGFVALTVTAANLF